MPPHILRIDCPDEPGLVHKITGVLFNAGYNILNNQEFVDLEAKHFFMRTAFRRRDGAGSGGFLSSSRCCRSRRRQTCDYRATAGGDPGNHRGALPGRSFDPALFRRVAGADPRRGRNHETLGALVKPFGIPFHCVSHKDLDRTEHEKQVIEVIDSYAPEYIVLAKYMRILDAELCGALSATESLTSTIRFCLPSSAPSRTIKPTCAASRSSARRRTSSPTISTPGRSLPRT